MPLPTNTKPKPRAGSVDEDPVKGKLLPPLPSPLALTVVTVEPSVVETSIETV